jgi:N utilization substance protein B
VPSPSDIRRLAFQLLFQIDAQGGKDLDQARVLLDQEEGFAHAQRQEVFELARGAWEHRARADAEFEGLAPGWPAHRQAAVDRAILRLAHYELSCARAEGPVVIDQAVSLAREFSTEKSPAFVNALLDKVYKRLASAS